jgi:serine/threonine-protein kinase RsbW
MSERPADNGHHPGGVKRVLTIPSEPEAVTDLVHEALEYLELYQWEEKEVFGIHLAVEEAVVNAAKHGNKYDPAKLINVVYEVSPEKFDIRVEDEGPGFDPEAVPDPTLDENLDKPSGRGLLMMRMYMNGVEYLGRGNVIQMHKIRGVQPEALFDDDEDDDDVWAD